MLQSSCDILQPIGSLMYSTAFSANGTYDQVIQWHLFIGADLCVRFHRLFAGLALTGCTASA